MRKIAVSVAALLLCASSVLAQVKVTGTVVDSYGPVVGATVLIKGTSTGAVTDLEGNFSLNVDDPKNAVLIVRYVGMNEVQQELNGKTSGIEIKMTESADQLDEVVVIGYGTQKRGNLTGAVASVSGKVLENVPTASVAEALVGKLPGVQITSVDGSPDAEIMIKVRGGGSITQDNSPLILVDGFEVSNLNEIPPTDVESVEVLKDASSTAIYGARGANGVILVTTKQPKEGRLTVNFNSYIQLKTLSKKLDVMDPYEFVLMQYEYARQRNSQPADFWNQYGHPEEFYIYQGNEGIDWQDEIFGTNPITQYYDVNVNGGTERTKFKVGYIHQDQPGVLIGSGMRRNNVNFTFNTKLSDRFTFEYRTRFMDQTVDGSGTESVSLITALREAPTNGLMDYMQLPEDDSYIDEDQELTTDFNPIEEAAANYRKRQTMRLNTQAALTWNILEGLTFRTEFGYEYNNYEDRRFYGIDTDEALTNNNLPVLEWTERKGDKWQLTNTLNYHFTLDDDKHDFQVLLGQELKHDQTEQRMNSARYFPEYVTAATAFDNLSLGTPYENSSSKGSPTRVSSFFGRINYSFQDKYLATFTIRADGSTKFGPDNRWGVFPAAALAWRISNEDFLKDSPVVSNLKLRLSFGSSGNDRIDSDLYQKLYAVSSSRPAGWNETSSSYYRFYNTDYLYNPEVQWETTITRNLGLDFGFFNERLNGTLDFYWNTVKDLLVPSRIPGVSGYTQMMSNMGQTSNRGVELALNAYLIENKDFTLGVNFNIGYNKNKIDKLASGETEWIQYSNWAGSDMRNNDDYRAYVGGSSGLIYGFVNDGFYKVEDFDYNETTYEYTLKPGIADATSVLGRSPAPGDPKFKKLTPIDPDDPSSALVTAESDRKVIGETTPKFSGGFGVNATWKGFDLNLFFNYMVGFDVYNATWIDLVTWHRNDNNNFSMDVASDKRFRTVDDMGNDLSRYPEQLAKLNENATMWNPKNMGPIAMSDAIEDGSFLRLNTATLGYTFPNKWTRKFGVNRLRLYFTGYNLFTLTGYSGYDPEVNIGNGLTPNVDYDTYPRTRNYTFGIQLTL